MIPGASTTILKAGKLAFTAYEMGEGPLVLCLHGFPDTPFTWRFLLPALAAAGFRAVAVTSRGYEATSQPADGDFSMAALSEDVIGWIDALGADTAHLVGHDWGSSIMHAAAARAPERVRSLTALAVPHPAGFGAAIASNLEQIERSWYVFFFQMRGLADLVVEQDGWAFLERLWQRWSPGWSGGDEDIAQVKAVFSKPGVKEAALAYYRTAFVPDHPRAAEGLQLWSTPIEAATLGLTGSGDGCISSNVFRAAMAPGLFAAEPALHEIEHAGHFLHLERPEIVRDLTLAHLRAHT
jgi:pimeloyl-ACP methyl ester carboxylesterase